MRKKLRGKALKAYLEAKSRAGQKGGARGGPAAYSAMTEEQRAEFHAAGGKASAAKLTPAQRSARAKRAVQAREAKRRARAS